MPRIITSSFRIIISSILWGLVFWVFFLVHWAPNVPPTIVAVSAVIGSAFSAGSICVARKPCSILANFLPFSLTNSFTPLVVSTACTNSKSTAAAKKALQQSAQLLRGSWSLENRARCPHARTTPWTIVTCILLSCPHCLCVSFGSGSGDGASGNVDVCCSGSIDFTFHVAAHLIVLNFEVK